MQTLPNTPLFQQYGEIKKKYPDCILFYQLGDFYEMFFADATRAAPILEVQLTSRDKNAENPIPMCGVPHHSSALYIQKLLSRGLKVAICEQMEDPSATKGLVRREVTRVLTPALVPDPDLVPSDRKNILVAVTEIDPSSFEICYLDLLAGDIRVGKLPMASLWESFFEWHPKELLVSSQTKGLWLDKLTKLFPELVVTIRDDYFRSGTPFQAVKSYLSETQIDSTLLLFKEPKPLLAKNLLELDPTSLGALEVLEHKTLVDGPSLFKVLNRTSTSMGRRLLKEWLSHPLFDEYEINGRLDAVENFVNFPGSRSSCISTLRQVRDLERLATKSVFGLATPRDLGSIRDILKALPVLKRTLKPLSSSRLLRDSADTLNLLEPLTQHLSNALVDTPPSHIREGMVFRDAFSPEIAEYRRLTTESKEYLSQFEARERERTGIPNLRVSYSKMFGYTIEITKTHLTKVPQNYIRKQTISNGERFLTEELKVFEDKIVTSEMKLRRCEEDLFYQLRTAVAECAQPLLLNSRILAALDVLLSFAEVAVERAYVKPKIHTNSWDLTIREGRHPVLETLLPRGQFVPNDITLIENTCRTLLLTGPNMSGKSTVMRQVALITLMAHAGSFVPAQSARIPLVDAIFTRIGSSDDLSQGQSTFLMEMTEVSRIFRKASAQSLILVDEVGRGTSTYDGLALAWALLEYLHGEVRAKTLFATHFHELTTLEKALPQLKNANVTVEKRGEEIIFLRKLVFGSCNKSYGIEVARLAGLPLKVISRAGNILGILETQSQRADRGRSRALDIHDNQLAFFGEPRPPESRL